MLRKNILLVEDNPDDEELALLAFRQHSIQSAKQGIQVELTVARDGIEAIEHLSDDLHRSLPNIILLDLKLPKVSGIEVLRYIRENETTHRLPVIILTTSNDAKDLAACYDLGCNSYVRKSVNFNEFLEATWSIQHYWLHHNEDSPRVAS